MNHTRERWLPGEDDDPPTIPAHHTSTGEAMRLNRAGQEYIHFPVDGAPDDAAQLMISFDGAPWTTATWSEDRTSARVLLAGPEKENPDPEATVLAVGRHKARLRLTDTPEDVVRSAPTWIDVV